MNWSHWTSDACRAATLGACLLALASPSALADERIVMTDQAITDHLEDELQLDASVNSLRVDAKTREGIVTLRGTVPSLLARDRAEEIARTVKGVRGIVNLLQVKTASRTDAELKADVARALSVDPVTEAYEVRPVVAEGEVTLRGTVDSFHEKRLAERVVKGVRGLTGFTNELKVEVDRTRIDAEIQTEVEAALEWDALIDDDRIEVGVEDGVVKLSGIVGSAAERSRAAIKAWAAGVKHVDDSGLKVQDWAKHPRRRDTRYPLVSDPQIAQAIKDAFFYDPRVLSGEVKASVRGGVATLRGSVASLKARRSAERTASSVIGVHRVKNRVKVRPQDVRDRKLRMRVREAIQRDPYLESYQIGVSATHGVVTLTGQVTTHFERGQADDVVSAIPGVLSVDNDLCVQRTYARVFHDPYVDYGWVLYDYPWFNLTIMPSAKADAELAEDVRDELWWSPYVDEDDITVSVEDGVVTLEGTVSSRSERMAARENAREAGAFKVRDRMIRETTEGGTK